MTANLSSLAARNPLESSSDADSDSSGSEYKDSSPTSTARSSDSCSSTHDEYSEYSVPSLGLSGKISPVLPNFRGPVSPSLYSSLYTIPPLDESFFNISFFPDQHLDAGASFTDRSLPTPTHTQRLNIVLLELYASHECLWNINDSKFLDCAAKTQAWRAVSCELEKRNITCASPDFCRRRVDELRHLESRYRLRQIRKVQHQRRVVYGRRVVLHLDPKTLWETEEKLTCSICAAYNATSRWANRKPHAFLKCREYVHCPTRDISMSMSDGDQRFEERSQELLPEGGFEQCFKFLDKIIL